MRSLLHAWVARLTASASQARASSPDKYLYMWLNCTASRATQVYELAKQGGWAEKHKFLIGRRAGSHRFLESRLAVLHTYTATGSVRVCKSTLEGFLTVAASRVVLTRCHGLLVFHPDASSRTSSAYRQLPLHLICLLCFMGSLFSIARRRLGRQGRLQRDAVPLRVLPGGTGWGRRDEGPAGYCRVSLTCLVCLAARHWFLGSYGRPLPFTPTPRRRLERADGGCGAARLHPRDHHGQRAWLALQWAASRACLSGHVWSDEWLNPCSLAPPLLGDRWRWCSRASWT
jgi:hypothetical protein